VVVASSGGAGPPPKLVTFLGKGGSGKTTAATIAAQVANLLRDSIP
jgi:predicted ATPase